MLGIDVGAWFSSVIAFAARSPAEVAGHIPLLDPGPLASAIALAVATGFVLHGRRAQLGRRTS
jgi:hypothetical protein